MKDVWGYLLTKFGLTTLLDVGCGYGHAMRFFADHLVTVQGIDGDPACQGPEQQCPGCVLTHDYTTGSAPLGPRLYDLAWSAEFLEHVEFPYVPNYMRDFRRCRIVVVTHAEPGQNGHHHCLCETDAFWVEKFYEYGFDHNPNETALLRRTDRWHAPWGRRTLMFFDNRNPIAL